ETAEQVRDIRRPPVNYLAYPRLPDSAALVRLHEMRTMAEDDPKRLQELVAVDHPLAQPVPTGASLATSDQILSVRESVTDALAHWLTGTEVPRGQALDFEVTLGRVLHESLRIMPADAGHDETWSFLAAVVFP